MNIVDKITAYDLKHRPTVIINLIREGLKWQEENY